MIDLLLVFWTVILKIGKDNQTREERTMSKAAVTLKQTSVIRWVSIAFLIASIVGMGFALNAMLVGASATVTTLGIVLSSVGLLGSMSGVLYADVKFSNLVNSLR